jgi:thioredoxin 2
MTAMSNFIHVVCPHCQTTNRVQPEHLGSAPNCGSCKSALFTGHPIALDDSSFDKQITRNQIPVLVDFWASWCGPCRTMEPAYAQAAARLEPEVRVAKLDTEAAKKISDRYGVRSIPTMILFIDGKEVARRAGALTSASQIVQWARHYTARTPIFG